VLCGALSYDTRTGTGAPARLLSNGGKGGAA
jgi:hypothetical protein